MPRSPLTRITPPTKKDTDSLKDFSAIIQRVFDDLYDSAHDHSVLSSDPSASDGQVGDIKIVDDGTDVYFTVKTARGWFKSSALTAL